MLRTSLLGLLLAVLLLPAPAAADHAYYTCPSPSGPWPATVGYEGEVAGYDVGAGAFWYADSYGGEPRCHGTSVAGVFVPAYGLWHTCEACYVPTPYGPLDLRHTKIVLGNPVGEPGPVTADAPCVVVDLDDPAWTAKVAVYAQCAWSSDAPTQPTPEGDPVRLLP